VNTVGIHCILELYGCPVGLLNDAVFIQRTLREAAIEGRATLLNEVAHEFRPHGVTALALLSESHIAFHSWPETGYAAADVFTCGRHTDPEKACLHLVRRFKARDYSLVKLPRGGSPSAIRRGRRTPRYASAKRQPSEAGTQPAEALSCPALKFAPTSG
jgi:S-adenosylmethionine decarboxylase